MEYYSVLMKSSDLLSVGGMYLKYCQGKNKNCRNYLVCFHFYNKNSPVHICIMVGEGKDTSLCDNTV